jgi:hypothetical protein
MSKKDVPTTFSEGEVLIMNFILQTLLRGGNPSAVTRHKDS